MVNVQEDDLQSRPHLHALVPTYTQSWFDLDRRSTERTFSLYQILTEVVHEKFQIEIDSRGEFYTIWGALLLCSTSGEKKKGKPSGGISSIRQQRNPRIEKKNCLSNLG